MCMARRVLLAGEGSGSILHGGGEYCGKQYRGWFLLLSLCIKPSPVTSLSPPPPPTPPTHVHALPWNSEANAVGPGRWQVSAGAVQQATWNCRNQSLHHPFPSRSPVWGILTWTGSPLPWRLLPGMLSVRPSPVELVTRRAGGNGHSNPSEELCVSRAWGAPLWDCHFLGLGADRD